MRAPCVLVIGATPPRLRGFYRPGPVDASFDGRLPGADERLLIPPTA